MSDIPEYSVFKADFKKNLSKRYIDILKVRLSEKRYLHSLAVADEAVFLAEKYGADKQKAYIAGLLHDITKEASEENHLNIFKTFGIILSDVEKNAFKLWHAISGAEYIKHLLLIDDEDIYDAVRYHTTAKDNLSLLSKVIYIADYTSRDRDYDDVDVIRQLAYKSLDQAYIYALKYTITDLTARGLALHPDTVKAYNEIVLKGENA